VQLALVERPATTAIRKRRDLAIFDSRESAYRWMGRNYPRQPRGAVCVCPGQPQKDESVGGWVIMFPVTFPGHVKYFRLGKGGHLLAR